MARTAKPQKVQAQYRLPETLYKRVKVEAAHRGVRPCDLVEQVLTDGLNRRPRPESEPAAAS